MVVLQERPDPQGSGHLVLEDADAFARKVRCFMDAGPSVDVYLAVPEIARHEDGQADEATVAARCHDQEGAERHLRKVELGELRLAAEEVSGRLEGDVIQVDSRYLDIAEQQRQRAV